MTFPSIVLVSTFLPYKQCQGFFMCISVKMTSTKLRGTKTQEKMHIQLFCTSNTLSLAQLLKKLMWFKLKLNH